LKFNYKAYIGIYFLVLIVFLNIISFFIEIFIGGLAGSISEIIAFILPIVILAISVYKQGLASTKLSEYERKYFRNFTFFFAGIFIAIYLFNNYTVQEYFFKLLDYLNITL
jgi:hypothetical protein